MNRVDPSGLQTVVITTYDSFLGIRYGSHSAVWVANDGDGYEVIYDPGGEYFGPKDSEDRRGSGGFVMSKNEALLDDYINYQKSLGSEVETQEFNTTINDQMNIVQTVVEQGDALPGLCANFTAGALKGSQLFKELGNNYFFPGSLYDDLKNILETLKKKKNKCQ